MGTGSTRTHLWTKPSTGSIAVVLIWGGGGAGGRDGGVGGVVELDLIVDLAFSR